jgi:hypothetical protein
MTCVLCGYPVDVGALCARCKVQTVKVRAWKARQEANMAHKGQVGEQKGGSLGGKPTDMKTVKTVTSKMNGKGC